MKQKIVIATGNRHKIRELETLLLNCGLANIELLPITDLVSDFSPDESGDTFETNAWIKANHACEVTGLPSLADDSGLMIDLLHGEPGVHSARYSGLNATDAGNREKVRARLDSIGAEQSPASFRCVLCLVTSDTILFGEGNCRGTIQTQEFGDNGFGYDSMFTPHGSTLTFGQMDESAKAQYSHRALACKHLVDQLLPDVTEAPSTMPIPHFQSLVIACIHAAKGAWEDLQLLLQTAITSDDDISPYYEALLQTYLFAGFPTAIEALIVLHEVISQRFPSWNADTEVFDEVVFRERGRKLFSRIYSGVGDRMLTKLSAVTPDLADWMILEGYGKTLSRDSLDVVHRELCIVAVLAVLNHQRQLTSHVRGAFLVGATFDQLTSVVTEVGKFCSARAADTLQEIILRYRV